MNEEQIRALFEKVLYGHINPNNPLSSACLGLGADGKYFNMNTRTQFESFKLGMKAVVVELPKPWQTNAGAMLTPNGVKFAIEAAGGTVKS